MLMEPVPSSLDVQYTRQITKKAKMWQDGKMAIKEGQARGAFQTSIVNVETNTIVERLI